MIVQLLTEHHLEFLSLKAGCRGSSESTLVKMSKCWKSHAAAQIKQTNQRDVLVLRRDAVYSNRRWLFQKRCVLRRDAGYSRNVEYSSETLRVPETLRTQERCWVFQKR